MFETQNGATLSDCGRYRLSLWRDIAPSFPGRPMVVVGLNPSTADASEDDPTIRRCRRFARDSALNGLVMVNLYAFRATHPEDLWRAPDPEGPGNRRAIVSAARAGLVVVAWGRLPVHALPHARSVLADLVEVGPVYALRTNRDGSPGHPLYLPATCRPTLYEGAP